MQTDNRTQASVSLANGQFRTGAGRPTAVAAETVAPIAPGAMKGQARPPGQTPRGFVHIARGALVASKYAATRTIAAARWSGEQASRLASKLKSTIARLGASPTVVADRFGVASQYASVANRLSALGSLSEEQQAVVRNTLPGRRTHQAGSTLLAEGEQTPHPTFILSGWVARTRVQNGKLHILGILLPGDGICLFGPSCTVATTTLIALTTVDTAEADPILELVGEAVDDSPLRLSLHRAMAEDEAFLLNQTMRLMMKPAIARLVHLLLELQYRLARAGLATTNEMPFALDRRMVAAALGLTPGAVGRVVRVLEQRRIARFGHNKLRILRPDVLRQLGGFTPPGFSERSGRRLIRDASADQLAPDPGPWLHEMERRLAN